MNEVITRVEKLKGIAYGIQEYNPLASGTLRAIAEEIEQERLRQHVSQCTRYSVGQKVQRVYNDVSMTRPRLGPFGEVRGIFTDSKGKIRYAVEFATGSFGLLFDDDLRKA